MEDSRANCKHGRGATNGLRIITYDGRRLGRRLLDYRGREVVFGSREGTCRESMALKTQL